MTTFKKGDRVKVEFEGVVPEDQEGDDSSVVVEVKGGRWHFLSREFIAPIEPEYEEGEMYVDAEGHYFAYFSGANHLYPWFAPGSMRGRAPGYPKRPLTKLVPEEKK